jgi:hypothetical protein
MNEFIVRDGLLVEGDIVANNISVDSITINGVSGGVINASTVTYNHPQYDNIAEALDSLLYVVPDVLSVLITINSYVGYKSGNNLEVGSSVTDLDITWTLNKTLNGDSPTASLNQSIGSVVTTKGPNTHNYINTFTGNKTFTLSVSELDTDLVTQNDSRGSSVNFIWNKYWGTSASISLNDASIIALQNYSLSTNNNSSFSTSPSAEYIYFVSPQSFGTASFVVGGLSVTFQRTEVNGFTNASGGSTNYYVYRSQTVQNGSNISIEVS